MDRRLENAPFPSAYRLPHKPPILLPPALHPSTPIESHLLHTRLTHVLTSQQIVLHSRCNKQRQRSHYGDQADFFGWATTGRGFILLRTGVVGLLGSSGVLPMIGTAVHVREGRGAARSLKSPTQARPPPQSLFQARAAVQPRREGAGYPAATCCCCSLGEPSHPSSPSQPHLPMTFCTFTSLSKPSESPIDILTWRGDQQSAPAPVAVAAQRPTRATGAGPCRLNATRWTKCMGRCQSISRRHLIVTHIHRLCSCVAASSGQITPCDPGQTGASPTHVACGRCRCSTFTG